MIVDHNTVVVVVVIRWSKDWRRSCFGVDALVTGAVCDGYAALIDFTGREPKTEFIRI